MIRNRVCSKKNCATDLIRNCTFGSGKETLIQISKHSDELAKIIGHSDEAKQLKLAIANGANDNITRPMVDKINDIVDSADKIEFKPKATLMDDVVGNVWEGKDKYVPELANAIEQVYPERIKSVERIIKETDGKIIMDLKHLLH